MKQCARCKQLIPYGRHYCRQCQNIVDFQRAAYMAEHSKAANRRYNRKRDPKYTRFYNSPAWRAMSDKRLSMDHYKCAKCGGLACEVDHIIPIQTPEGWARRFDIDNTQSLCTTCHNEKHGRFVKKKKRVQNHRGG